MYRIIIFFIQLLILLAILSLIFSNPFIISFDINNLKYSFSSNIFIGTIISFIFLFYLLIYIFFKSKFSFNKYLLKNKYNRLEKGYHYFVEAMIAIANKDNRNAIKFHKKMNSFIKDDPALSLILKSEVFKIEKKIPELINVYDEMLKSTKTEALGYRGLMEQNLNNQDYHHAFLYGEKLFMINPFIEKLYETLVYIAAKTKNWNQLIIITDKAYSKKIIGRDTLNENKSIGFYEIAKLKSTGNLKEAIKNINKALDLKKNFPPYVKLQLELISESNNFSLLKKYIKKYWYFNPNYALRKIITEIIINNNLSELSYIYQVVKNNRDLEDSKKMLIFFAIKNQNWNVARDNILGLIGTNPSREVCLFMADIELGENNDKQKSDSWIARSEGSFQEKTWICNKTNKTQTEWSSLSDSGYFNSLVLSNSRMIEERFD